MPKNKINKVISKKKLAKKTEPVKQQKKSVPVKKATPKKAVPKKAAPKKAAVKSKQVAKVIAKAKVTPSKSSAVKKTTPAKKAGKPVFKSAPKKAVAAPKKAAAKQVIQPIVKKKTPVGKIVPKNEDKKPVPKAASSPALPAAKNIKVPAPKPVVLPKITATKARKYEPEFTKSVLDQAAPENNGPTMRYSDAELNEFKDLIQRKLETAKKELGYLQGLITRKDDMGGDESDNRYMTMEDGSLSMEREQLSQMASRQITFIDHLEKAMMRIENKTYGICRVTGKLIDKARLRAVPHATLSIEAKMGIAK